LRAPIGAGAELDGRPLTATSEVVMSWRWTCGACGLTTPSLEAASKLVSQGNLAGAARVALEASWYADDHDPGAAVQCREIAAWLLRRLGGREVLVADLYRRNGDFQAAASAARRALGSTGDPYLAILARHQLRLAQTEDPERQSMVELFGEALDEAG
jgi:hypothetical protein